MKKRVLAAILVLAMAVTGFGCGKSVSVKLGTYKGMTLTNVSDEEVEETIEDLLDNYAGCMEVERAAANDDTVNMDYTGVYYGDVSVTFSFELVDGYTSYTLVPGTTDGTNFTPLFTAEVNNYATVVPASEAADGEVFYLDGKGELVITDTTATSLTVAIKADFVKEMIEKQLSFTAQTNGVKVTSEKVLAVSSTDDKTYTTDADYVGDGNLVNSVSYEAFAAVYGVAFTGGSASGYDIVVGSGSFITGFEDGLIGHSAGEEFDIALSFPSSYSSNTRLSGQPVVFTVKINAVKEDPEFNDAFAQYMGYDDVAAYRQYLVDTINDNSYENQITQNLLDICTVKNLPEDDVTTYKDNFVNYYTSMASYYASYYTAYGYSITSDYILQYFFGYESTDALNEAGQEYAENYLSLMYIIRKIASVENITYNDDDFNETALEYAENSGYDTYEEFLEAAVSDDDDKAEIEDEIAYVALLGNVLDFIKESAVTVDPTPTPTPTATAE